MLLDFDGSVQIVASVSLSYVAVQVGSAQPGLPAPIKYISTGFVWAEPMLFSEYLWFSLKLAEATLHTHLWTDWSNYVTLTPTYIVVATDWLGIITFFFLGLSFKMSVQKNLSWSNSEVKTFLSLIGEDRFQSELFTKLGAYE